MKPSVNPYLRTKVMTASPEELRLMLYDGCLKFARAAKDGIANKDFEQSFENLQRAQKIVLELSSSLKHDLAPDLCGKLSALYTYIYRLLVDASTQRQAEPIEEAIKLLSFERETWTMLMQRNSEEREAQGAASGGKPVPQAQQSMLGAYARSA